MLQTIPLPSPSRTARQPESYAVAARIPARPEGLALAPSPLTGREGEILGLVAEGYSNKLIGCQLYISERTVKNHLTNIMIKLHALDRTHAVVTAVRRGWLRI
ncbi:MAG: response regulator transcription factor [Chloroflexi bacterium]|nr:response regulator transcription factor [Chloroflexota bacterium]